MSQPNNDTSFEEESNNREPIESGEDSGGLFSHMFDEESLDDQVNIEMESLLVKQGEALPNTSQEALGKKKSLSEHQLVQKNQSSSDPLEEAATGHDTSNKTQDEDSEREEGKQSIDPDT